MSNRPMEADLAIAHEFLHALDPRGVFTFQTFDDNSSRKSRGLARVLHGTLDQHAAPLASLNGQGAGVFVMVNEGDLKGRAATNVRAVRALFVDLDGAPLDPVISCTHPPHIVVDTSPGRYHAYWLVNDCALESFKQLQHAFALRFGGDTSVIDLPRVMRLPGFLHMKGTPSMTTARAVASRRPYRVADLAAGFGLTTHTSTNARAIAGIQVGPDPLAPCAEGERNSRLTSLVGMWLREGKGDEEISQLAQQWNDRLASPLPAGEVLDVCASMRRTHERNRSFQPTAPAPGLAPQDPDWEEPILFDTYETPDIPANLLPKEFGEFAKALAIATETPDALSVFAVLGVISTAVAKRFVVTPKPGWNEPLNIYTLVALPPANNKSAVLNAVTTPLREWEIDKALSLEPERKRLQSEKRNQEALIASMRAKAGKAKDGERLELFREITSLEANLPELKPHPQLFANDATPESLAQSVFEQGGRFAVITDEGGITETFAGLYTGGTANIDLILKGIDGGDVRVRRKDRSFDLKPYLTFLLTVQPRIIQNMNERRAFRGNGMLERFLYVVPRSKLGYRTLTTPAVPDQTRMAFNAAVRRLLDIQPILDQRGYEIPRSLTLSPGAAESFARLQHAIEKELRPGGQLATFMGWGGKLAGYAARLAGLLHVGECGESSKEIAGPTMMRAIAIALLLTRHARAAFDLMGLDQATEDAKAVFDWIRARGATSFRKTDCHRALHGRFVKVGRLAEALRVLTERHIISEPERCVTTAGKRATTYYRVNPSILGLSCP